LVVDSKSPILFSPTRGEGSGGSGASGGGNGGGSGDCSPGHE